VLRLGVLTVLAAGPHLLQIVDAFTARHPECRVEVAQASLSDPFSQVSRGEVDVMASWLPLEQPDLTVGPVIWEEPRVLAVARDHALAQRDGISFEDLADAAVAAYVGLPDELHEAWIPSRTPSGRTIPRVGQPMAPNDVTTLAVRLALGEIVHPTVPSASRFLGDLGIVYLPIAGMPPLRSALVWHRGRTDLRVREFADTARDVLKAAAVRFEPAQPAPVAA